MPSKSAKQAKFMRAVAGGMKPKGKKGPARSVAREFARADALRRRKHPGYEHKSPAGWKDGKHYSTGGTTGGGSIGGGSAGGGGGG